MHFGTSPSSAMRLWRPSLCLVRFPCLRIWGTYRSDSHHPFRCGKAFDCLRLHLDLLFDAFFQFGFSLLLLRVCLASLHCVLNPHRRFNIPLSNFRLLLRPLVFALVRCTRSLYEDVPDPQTEVWSREMFEIVDMITAISIDFRSPEGILLDVVQVCMWSWRGEDAACPAITVT